MNPLSAFFVRHLDLVFFLYGLAFFSMGLALALASRRASRFDFARAIRPLAVFGILHGIHEWIEMFQIIHRETGGELPSFGQEVVRLAVLVISMLMLLSFGLTLLGSQRIQGRRQWLVLLGMTAIWVVGVVMSVLVLDPSPREAIAIADVLARYCLAIPAGLLGAWAMMSQQHTFRDYGMPQFGRDLVWAAAALLLYGVVGQVFVPQSILFPSTILNGAAFLQWFGIPVQLFRGAMAMVLAVVMVRVLHAFDLENQRQLEEANQARLLAQQEALQAERDIRLERERLNKELRQTARELALLLEISNLLAAPMDLEERLMGVLRRLVRSLDFPSAGLIMLFQMTTREVEVKVECCEPTRDSGPWETWARRLGEQCAEKGLLVCMHLDGTILEASFEQALREPTCQLYESPTIMLAFPLVDRQQVIGALVLADVDHPGARQVSHEEIQLMVAVARHLGLSSENARLYQAAQEREQRLAELLRQVVGAQEAERYRIARELHDATSQSLTAIGLGLRGLETLLEMTDGERQLLVGQVRELKKFSTDALGELRHLIADLRPSLLDDMGLAAALKWYCQDFQSRRAIHTTFILEGTATRLPSDYETVLFRIAQEALANVAKHAQAENVTVVLRFDLPLVCLIVEDDGIGFDTEAILAGRLPYAGWGLMGIRERAALLGGQYAIYSEPGEGTRVWVTVPLEAMEVVDVQD